MTNGGVISFARRAESRRWHLGVKLASQTYSSLVHYDFMADDDPILAAVELKAPCANLCSFRVSDIILTTALLAGGAGPIHRLMDTFRKFMEAYGKPTRSLRGG